MEAINQGNSGLLELAQQAAQQIGQGGGSLREVDYANQLAVLSQRIAKNANTLAAADEIDPEVAFLLGKDETAFRDVMNGLAKGSDSMRLAPVRSEDARTTLAEIGKRFTALPGRDLVDPVEHGQPRRRQAGGAQRQQRGRAAADRHDDACRPVSERQPDARVHARPVDRVRAARTRLPRAWSPRCS